MALSEVTPLHVADFLRFRSEVLSPASLAQLKATLSSLFSFLVRVGHVSTNPVDPLGPVRVPDQTHYRVLSGEEMRRVVEMEDNPRNKFMLRLLFKTGLRVSELVSLKYEHFRKRGGRFVLIVTGKGSFTRSVLIDEAFFNEVQQARQSAQAKHQDFLFRASRSGGKKSKGPLSRVAVWRIVKKAALKSGLPKSTSPHWTRHTHATEALGLGEDIRVIQETLGHRSINTTVKYTRVNPNRSSSQRIDI